MNLDSARGSHKRSSSQTNEELGGQGTKPPRRLILGLKFYSGSKDRSLGEFDRENISPQDGGYQPKSKYSSIEMPKKMTQAETITFGGDTITSSYKNPSGSLEGNN